MFLQLLCFCFCNYCTMSKLRLVKHLGSVVSGSLEHLLLVGSELVALWRLVRTVISVPGLG
jgi:hypothetical protein